MPEIETWTFNRFKWDGKRVRQVGINFGAPGDRRAPDGLLWLEYPSVGGDSPDVPVAVEGEGVEYFRHHPSRVSGHDLDWVGSCGVTSATSITISLDKDEKADERPYSVRLHFAEVDGHRPGERVFDVNIQNASVLSDFDIVKDAGASNVGIVKEFKGIRAGKEMKIVLTPKVGKTLLCGVEIVAEGW